MKHSNNHNFLFEYSGLKLLVNYWGDIVDYNRELCRIGWVMCRRKYMVILWALS